jgi:hypothetical protein
VWRIGSSAVSEGWRRRRSSWCALRGIGRVWAAYLPRSFYQVGRNACAGPRPGTRPKPLLIASGSASRVLKP